MQETTLEVFYDEECKWTFSKLEKVQKSLGITCDHFDGFQASFDFETSTQALAALLTVRFLGFRARVGLIGDNPKRESVEEARRIMKRSYQR